MTQPIHREQMMRLTDESHLDVVGPLRSDPLPVGEIAAAAEGAEILLTQLTDPITAQLFEDPALRLVATVAVGVDNIDLRAAARAGVLVTNTPGVLTAATADMALALMLATARRVPEATASYGRRPSGGGASSRSRWAPTSPGRHWASLVSVESVWRWRVEARPVSTCRSSTQVGEQIGEGWRSNVGDGGDQHPGLRPGRFPTKHRRPDVLTARESAGEHHGRSSLRGIPGGLVAARGRIADNRRTFAGSSKGGIRETQEMLDFCADHDIASDVEVISGGQIDDAWERVLAGDVRYRFVIDTATF